MTTYIGATRPCIDDLTDKPDLEVLEVTVDQSVTVDSDKPNPPPFGRCPYGS